VTSVVLVDDQEMVRTGFRMILEARGIEVLGEAGDGTSGVEVVRRTRPDVVLMDVRMPGMDGIDATAALLDGDPVPSRVLILTTFDLDEYVYRALQAGASGFLLKDARPDELVRAIEVVAAGDALLAPSVTRRLIADFARGGPAGGAAAADPGRAKALASLTEREAEVLALLARGRSNAEIAAELYVGEATVKSHVSGLLLKLGLRDRVQAVVFAYEAGVVRPGDGTGA
jgi:DNA-binding NarL/FixJ family response regulator